MYRFCPTVLDVLLAAALVAWNRGQLRATRGLSRGALVVDAGVSAHVGPIGSDRPNARRVGQTALVRGRQRSC